MGTQNLIFDRYEYERILNPYKYLEYILKSCDNKDLPIKIRIEPNRRYNNGLGFTEILRLIDHKKIKDCKVLTGLRATNKENCFYGDLIQTFGNKGINSFILVQFFDGREKMVIDYFKNFRPYHDAIRRMVIDDHEFKY